MFLWLPIFMENDRRKFRKGVEGISSIDPAWYSPEPQEAYPDNPAMRKIYIYLRRLTHDPIRSMAALKVFEPAAYTILENDKNNEKIFVHLLGQAKTMVRCSFIPKLLLKTKNQRPYLENIEYLMEEVDYKCKSWLVRWYHLDDGFFDENYLHFMRQHHKYNKRPFARVRAISRPSFWAGMAISSAAIGTFWNSTIQSIDWLNAVNVYLGIDLVMLLFHMPIFCYLFHRYWRAPLRYWRWRHRAHFEYFSEYLPNWLLEENRIDKKRKARIKLELKLEKESGDVGRE